ncbi:esterase-like activity of phytase family protein [Pseudomonas solani]|uniref:esterase-like activity of phytase family protein n=1 Tax=Pseudomonas solani TaxID=2731552 RepID=UPI003C2EECE9
MKASFLLALLLVASPLWAAAPIEELKLSAEYPVEGVAEGNLSGIALCGKELLVVSDRLDDRLFHLTAVDGVMHAEAELFAAPPPPESGLPWGVRARTWAMSMMRGNELDFEGITCDAAGNRYLVSEAHAAVLQVNAMGSAEWLRISASLVRQARASGMLLHFNALLEGIAIDPNGERLWLAAERERRGLMVLHKKPSTWACAGGCVLFSEAGEDIPPPDLGRAVPMPKDFSDLAVHKGKLFTLERHAHRICRRDPAKGSVERCWSFAAEALTPPRRYEADWGLAEGLWVDADGAWIVLDNGGMARADGEQRPIVWRFAKPAGGWDAP